MKQFLTAFLCLMLLCAPGCANIKNDSSRTVTEGALSGAAVGAGLGAIVGALVGGGDGAAIGAAIGGAVGGVAGGAVGKHIADKKAEYASREEWLDACIAQARKSNDEARAYNARLKKDIAALNKQSTKLAADYKRKKVSTETVLAENKRFEERKAQVDATIAQLETELSGQTKVVADARAGNNTREADIIEREIAKMEKEIGELKQDSKRLAAFPVRVSQ